MNKNIIIIFIIVAAINSIICDTSKVYPDEYIVKSGDIFYIQSSEKETINIQSKVLPAGTLSLFPIADTVLVAGETLNSAYEIINKKINNKQITVQLSEISPIRFHLTGVVVNSGEFITNELVSLNQALNISGGLSASASKKISILRNEETRKYDLNRYFVENDLTSNPLIMHDDIIMLDYAKNYIKVFANSDTLNHVESVELMEEKHKISDVIKQLSNTHQLSNFENFTIKRDNHYLEVNIDFELKPNDRLFIPIEELYVYVTGFVNHPGKFPYNGNYDVSYYISQSGGPSPNGSRSKVYLADVNGKRSVYQGQMIKPGDIFFVPETYRSLVREYLMPVSTAVSIVSAIIILSNK